MCSSTINADWMVVDSGAGLNGSVGRIPAQSGTAAERAQQNNSKQTCAQHSKKDALHVYFYNTADNQVT